MKSLAAFLLLAAIAATGPLWPDPFSKVAASSSSISADWPAALVAENWILIPLSGREARFARDFPGRIGVFSTPDGRTIIVRQMNRPSRKLHPAGDCLRALGHAIAPGPLWRDACANEWNAFTATRGAERLQVRERLVGADDRRWTDFSAWYWSAALGRATGPWWAITEITPLPNPAALAP